MSLLGTIIDAVTTVTKGIRRVSFPVLFVDLISYVPKIINQISELINMKKDGYSKDELKELVDSALTDFDNVTGLTGLDENGKPTGKSIIYGMPLDKQEETLDAFKIVLRNLLYNKIGVKGY